MTNNPDVAKGFSLNQRGKERIKRQWELLTIKLNSTGNGAIKTDKQWIKYWADKRSSVKKKAARRNEMRHRTGGGLGLVIQLTENEEQILQILGGESYACGDQNLAINPFPTQNSEPNIPPSLQSSSRAQMIFPSPHLPQSSSSSEQIFTPPQRPSPIISPPALFSDEADTREERVSLDSNPASSIVLDNNSDTSRANISRSRASQGTQASDTSRERTQGASTSSTPRRRRRRGGVQTLSPPSQRRTQLTRLSERFLRIEERRIELESSLVEMNNRFIDHTTATNAMLAQALTYVGEGLRSVAEAISRN